MFFVQNSEGTIVAADREFLEAAGFESLLLAAEHFRSENIGPDPEHGLMDLNGRTFKFKVQDIHTLWGEGLLFLQENTQPVSEEVPPHEHSEVSLPVDTPETDTRTETVPTGPEEHHDTVSADSDAQEEPTPDSSPAAEEVGKSEEALEPIDREEIAELLSEPETPRTDEEEHTEETSLSGIAAVGTLGAGAAALRSAVEHFTDDTDTSPSGTTEDTSPAEKPELPIAESDGTAHQDPGSKVEEGSPEPFDLTELEERTDDAITQKEVSPGDDEPLELFDLAEPKEETTDTRADVQKEVSPGDDEPLELFDLAEPKEETSASEPSEGQPDLAEPTPAPRTDTVADGADSPEAAKPHTDAPVTVAKTAGVPYEQNAELIGISTEEYLTFLAQFVEESFKYEPHLRGRDLREFRSSLSSLKDASQLLHLPHLTDQLRLLEGATSDEKGSVVDDYYALIERIREDLDNYRSSHPDTAGTATDISKTPEPSDERTATPAPDDTPLQTSEDDRPDTAHHTSESDTPSADAETDGQMTMEEVQELLNKATLIPFDFSTHVASEELGLPEALVGEFVADFIQQAKENIPLMLSSHHKGDMPTLQSTAHLLKGAASNLRIDPLAKTLEEMQFNEDPQKVPALFDRFLGQLKALDNLIRQHGLN